MIFSKQFSNKNYYCFYLYVKTIDIKPHVSFLMYVWYHGTYATKIWQIFCLYCIAQHF